MHKSFWRSFLLSIAVSISVAATGYAAEPKSPDWPTRPVRMVVPFAPGGSGDIIARVLAPALSDQLGQRFIADNRPGAAGNIGVEIAARAQPDGYTILVGNVSTNTINPTTYASVLTVDAVKELTGVTMVASFPLVLVSRIAFPPNNMKELIAHALAKPGELNYTLSMGSATHLDWLDLMSRTGMKMVHLPSKGAGAAITDVISGEADIAFTQIATAIPQIKTGRLKPFVTISRNRLPDLPDVPNMAEAGFPGIGSELWVGIFVPAKTPRAIVEKLYAAVIHVVQSKQIQAVFAKTQVPVALSKSPKEFQQFVDAEVKRWARIVKETNFKNQTLY
jgi:tripartite-type tricarboxylate transporter receptor subunit TctC